MASFRDLLNAGQQVVVHVKDGAYASAAHSVGDGMHVVGDLLKDLFGFRASPDDPTDDDVNSVVVRLKTLEFPVGVSGPNAPVGAVDFTKLAAAIQKLLDLIEFVWKLFRPAPEPTA